MTDGKKTVYEFKNKIWPLSKKAGVKTDSADQQPGILDTPEQKRFNDFLRQIKQEQKNIDTSLFKEVFGYDTPDKMLQTLHNLKKVESYNQEAIFIQNNVIDSGNRIKKTSEGAEKNEKKKILKIASKILDSGLNEQKQRGQGIKILTPNQMLRRLPISLAQLKAWNNSEKLKNEIMQLLYSLYRSKKLTESIYKSLIDII